MAAMVASHIIVVQSHRRESPNDFVNIIEIYLHSVSLSCVGE